jgi:uncharacterized membrane protein
MELEKLFGLPAHPLLVHIPVVLIPLAGLIALVMAFRPAWLDRFGWGLVGLTGVGMIGAILAAGSGDGLSGLQNKAETAAREDHFNLGQTAEVLAIVFFCVVLVIVGLRWWAKRKGADSGPWGFARSKAGAVIAAVLLVAAAGAATGTMAAAGHQGAKLAWCQTTNNC